MHRKEKALEILLRQKMLPLFYHDSAEKSIRILESLYKAGVRTVEYTNRGEKALSNFIQIKKVAATNLPEMSIGIGTIKNKEQAQQYVDADADYIVCPSMNKKVASVARKAGLLWIPGCMTPTDIASAENAGATVVKIFPGNILGPTFISSVKDLFPNLLFMPTGGVEINEENLRSWFNVGVCAVGLGSKLISKEAMEGEDYQTIEQKTTEAIQIIKNLNIPS
jgi:2-dehydro-3-deoxyphosphogluconate aldolase / (4S)-4-hydroxy-2-oxoglutarate aldolase